VKSSFSIPFTKESSAMREHLGQDDISGFLAEGTEIKGEIRFRDILRVDGKISGKITSEGELVIGESGEVEAEVRVGTLSVSGRLSGTVNATEKVEIHPKGRVHGDVSIAKPNLVIHEGGTFEGNIDMGTAARPEAHDGDHDDEAKRAIVEPFRKL
jgi:cytoskeletal protein CcmA (bactofilin family)